MEMPLTSGGQRVDGSADLTPREPAQGLRRVLSYAWAFLPVLSFGFLAPVPIIHAAVKLRTRTLWAAAAVDTAAEILAWSATMTVTSGPVEPAEVSDPPGWAAALLMGLVVIPTIHALTLRGRVFEPKPQHPAIVAALQARQRREEARGIAARDLPWPASFGSAAPTCHGSSTTVGWSTVAVWRDEASSIGLTLLIMIRHQTFSR
jgi:hypothetical protein